MYIFPIEMLSSLLKRGRIRFTRFQGVYLDLFLNQTRPLKLTANAPENRPGPKRKRESIPTIQFSGAKGC